MRFGLRSLILLLVLCAMPVASFFLVFKPQNQRIEQAKLDIEHKKELLSKLRQETSRNADLVRANAEIDATIDSIEDRLPTGKEIDSVVRQVSDLAVQAGLGAPAMKSTKPVQAALYMEQPLEMQLGGDFSGFFTFLVNLERLPRITRIPDMKLRSVDREGEDLQAEFTLSIYFQDDGGSKQ
jgi:type IV pilus assembly protein PilO